MALRHLLPALVTVALFVPRSDVSFAATAPDLTGRIIIDGISSEFTEGEGLFGLNEGVPEEDTNDSVWGPFNDLNQIKMTWDAESLYVACDGFIWDNNMILLIDPTGADPDDEGLPRMTDLNAWRRNFTFSEDFSPDMFLATWDGNSAPQFWTVDPSQPDQIVQAQAGTFIGVASFLQNTPGRSMEAAIPWNMIFGGQSSRITDVNSGVDTWEIPEEMDHLRLAAVITAGPDGTGGPDSAPDNLTGHQTDSAVLVTIDNYVIVPLDENDDGIVDFDIEPRDRVDFKLRPPFQGIRFEVASIEFDRKIASPEESRPMSFRTRLSPELGPDDDVRTIALTAHVYDGSGNLVRTLYTEDRRLASDPNNPDLDQWDGRDANGRMVKGGIYVLSVISGELPGQSQSTAAFGVVR